MVDVAVNPSVLEWARIERGLGEVEAANRVGVSVQELAALERGDKTPTISELRTIAKAYEIAFASLLMPEPLPLATRPDIEDFRFRTFRSEPADRAFELNLAIESVFGQIDFLSELKTSAPDLFVEFDVPQIGLEDDVEEVAAEERRRLGLTVETQFRWERPKQSFETLRLIVEREGAFVLQKKLGSRDTVRGFSILDDRMIPVAVVNQDEGDYGPKNFTLFHEYAHLLLRHTGISDENREIGIERFCNQFAAFFLMPRQEFIRVAHGADVTGTWTDRELGNIATVFRVSLSAVAIHLEDTRVAEPGLYDEKQNEWRRRNIPPRGGGRATWPERWLNSLGVGTTQIALEALDRAEINQLEAFELLDVRPKFFDQLRNEMEQRIADYGGAGREE